ncbi:hypothetical protein [Solimonas marina]|uniref:Uncharacterized protein n=1 Tax=Solimonas marina TaxID=2714601 RepID=A0A969W6I6_9GAMM|nr:hypothetical protein [Solimonas marina]NKF21566.1 hypothetical protein [Solimonas marina]
MTNNTKPPTQAVGVSGIDAHGSMQATSEPMRSPHGVLMAGSRDAGFQAFVYARAGRPGPATPAGTVEAVFGLIGASNWSDLGKPECATAFVALLKAYAAGGRSVSGPLP